MNRIQFWLACSVIGSFVLDRVHAYEQGCFHDLDDIMEREERLIDDTMLRTYVLCSGTTFDIAKSFGPDGVPVDGQSYV